MGDVRPIRVALAGCGVVGSELVRAMRAQEAKLEREHGLRLQLERVLVRRPERPRPVELAPGVLTADLESFLATPVDAVVEAIGGLDPATRIARSATERALPLVTANKVLIAAEGEELCAHDDARRAGAYFEAAVAGGVPVVRVLREYLGRGRVRRIRGILNGTCNFVLTLLERGEPFEEAVLEAQRRGFAESDPTRDLDGRDAADKIAILAWLAFGVSPGSVRIRRRGLIPDAQRLTQGAAAAGGRLRLIAECALEAEGVTASVEPIVLAPESPFARTIGEENRITIDAGWSWPIELAGPGAGGVPTASALLADLIQATTSPLAPLARSASPGANGSNGMHRASRNGIHARASSERGDGREHAWLIGVRAGAARDARASLCAEGIAAAPAGATNGDGWIATGPVRWTALESVLELLEHEGARPAVARLETAEVQRVSTESAARIVTFASGD